MKRTAIALAAFACCGAHAMDIRSEYTASNSIIEAARVQANDAISKAGNSAKAVARVNFTGPGGAAIGGDLTVTMSQRSLLLAGAKTLGRFLGPLGLAWTAYEVYQAVRMRGDGEGGLLFDPGQEPVIDLAWRCNAGANWNNYQYGSAGQACAAYVQQYNQPLVGVSGSVQCANGGYANVSFVKSFAGLGPDGTYGYTTKYTYTAAPVGPGYSACSPVPAGYTELTGGLVGQSAPAEICPQYTDGGTVVPKGAPKGFDGRCPTGDHSVPKTPDEARDTRSGAPGLDDINYPGLLHDAASGPDGFPVPQDSDYRMPAPGVTPNVVQGTTTTTTKPDGSTQEDTEEWRASTANSIGGPNGNRLVVPWTKTTTTTTRDPQGNPTGTTTTSTSPGTVPGVAGSASGGASDPCATDPGRLSCIGLGAIPPEPSLVTITPPVNGNPDSGWGASNGVCPAPRTVTVLGRPVVVDNTVLCTWLGNIRFLIIGFAALSAIRITLGGVKD